MGHTNEFVRSYTPERHFLGVWTTEVSNESWHQKSARRFFHLPVFCWKNNSTFKAHLKLCRHLLSTPFPLYVLERSFCEWKENIIYMHVLIRPMSPDSRQLARQSCSAESKWKWKLRRIYSVTPTKITKNPRCIIRLQSRLWGEKKHASWQTRHFRLPLRRLTGKLGL